MVDSWRGVAAEYDRSFARLCAGAIELLLAELGAPVGPARFLDAGCGTGTVSEAAFQRGWRVTAVDLEADMTAFTAARLSEVETLSASLADIPVEDGGFGAIAANFAINHVDHADRVAAELHRVAAPGARIAATVWPWQPTAMNELWGAIMDATGTRPAQIRMPEGELFERSEAGLSALLQRGGFRDASARRLRWTFEIAPDDLWIGIAAGIAVIGQAYREAGRRGRAALRREYATRTGELATDGLLRFPVEAILAVATA